MGTKTISARENYCKFACIMPPQSCSCCLQCALDFRDFFSFLFLFWSSSWVMFMHNPHLVPRKWDPSERLSHVENSFSSYAIWSFVFSGFLSCWLGNLFFFFCIFLLFVNTILCQDWQDSLASVITGERSVDFAATLLILLRIENSALYMPKKYIYILNQN